ncbi:hypothetical protein GUJ93_ZPchr0007g6416 [Zizania palustris]|uniref:Uncharacterized protein n=1 Tax=Zizania palustris TaxID=103762 RepID=A0A8J5VS17_ZIZPA|nr:hypothetical protein GUJ93_ZPchr0007g6416 [Zizania palustris]
MRQVTTRGGDERREDAVRCKVVTHIKSDATEKALAAMRAAEWLSATTSCEMPRHKFLNKDSLRHATRHIAGEFHKAVKVADQVLTVAPGDEDAVRCKVVAHIKSDATEKVLAAIRAAERHPIDLSYYKAYCYYRQNKLQEV